MIYKILLPVVRIIAILTVVVLFVVVFNKLIRTYRSIEKAKQTPAEHKQAVLISKVAKVRPVGYSSRSDMYLAFEFPDKTRKNFRVNADVYNTILEGEKGILTYHELGDTRIFVSFQRTN